ncbi:MAG: DUF4384 domain-containing protein [Muribaculaceae bacterium]|nr:DUF4384 domain-containing protein [Muribaculaceae bacterium]
MKRLIVILSIAFSAMTCISQKTAKVSARYTYHVPENVSLEEAKHTALDRAKIDAIEKEFGSHVSQVNTTSIESSGTDTRTTFSSKGGSEVRGEWIETTKGPDYDVKYVDGMLVVEASVSGIIREYPTNKTEIEAKILKNGIEPRFEDMEFYNDDQMYLSFSSPVAGHLLVYLVDNSNNAYRLLPYRRQKESNVTILASEPYVFFDKSSCSPEQRRTVDEYVLTTSSPHEINTVYVIFSRDDIEGAIDSQTEKNLPRELSGASFQQWLGSLRRNNHNVTVKELPLTIRSRK